MTTAANESMMGIMVDASLQGHNLTEWKKVENGDGWQAVCRKCDKSVWVGSQGLIYSLLDDTCPTSKVE